MRKMTTSSRPKSARNEPQGPVLALFDALEPVIESVRTEAFIEPGGLTARLRALRAAFPADYQRLHPALALLTGQDIAGYGAAISDIFAAWEDAGGGPGLPVIAAAAIQHFGLDGNTPLVSGLVMASILGEMPNSLQYHGNEHYRKVLFHAIRLAARHNELFARDEKRKLSGEMIAMLLTAACIHDLGHQGGDNLKEGVYTPGNMEQRSFDIARPYFEALGMDPGRLRDIETIVFCTDITFFAGDNSPCVRMKKIYKHYYWDDDSGDVPTMMMGKLRRFEGNPMLVLAAMILHEADVGTSAGLSYARTIKETVDLMAERGVNRAGPATVLAFLREQLGETMFTEAGKQIFGPVMTQVIAQAEKDVAAGRKSFL
jgi:hypothetical protein